MRPMSRAGGDVIGSRRRRRQAGQGSVVGSTWRCRPAPYGATDGMVMGSWPEIGANPSSARAAARCDTGRLPHAIRYASVGGSSEAMYGLLNVARITCDPAFWSPVMRSAIPVGAASEAVDELAPKYDET